MKNFRLAGILLSVLFCVCANASLMGIGAYSGTTAFNLLNGTSVLNVDVEYAVFAPGDYAGNDISGGSDYIYAYQIFSGSTSNVTVDFFSVGVPAGSINAVATDTGYGALGGVNPLAFNFTQSAGYMFIYSALNPGLHSTVLLFSSVHSPAMGFGTVSGGGLSGIGALAAPSLLPEPATVCILSLGALSLIRRKEY
ncbi:MAG: hypothetical protein WC770_05270 [Phycisphaerae bacterium]|jgi:hypothetical protein